MRVADSHSSVHGEIGLQNTDAPGSLETDMAACATRCDATPTCNAASYYADASLYGGNNCWLKVMGDTCELPGDAQTDAGATLLLKQDQCAARQQHALCLSLTPRI